MSSKCIHKLVILLTCSYLLHNPWSAPVSWAWSRSLAKLNTFLLPNKLFIQRMWSKSINNFFGCPADSHKYRLKSGLSHLGPSTWLKKSVFPTFHAVHAEQYRCTKLSMNQAPQYLCSAFTLEWQEEHPECKEIVHQLIPAIHKGWLIGV